MMKNKLSMMSTWREHRLPIKIACFALIVFLQYWTIEWSAKSLAEMFQCEYIIYLGIGIFTVLFADLALILMTKRTALSLSIISVISLLLAITNFYVSKWYGEPFSLEELVNAKTAFAVLGNYTFSLEKRIVELVVLCVASIGLSFFAFSGHEVSRKKVLFVFLASSCLVYACYGGTNPAIPRNAIAWSWDHAIRAYGYVPSFVQQSICGLNAVQKPDGYNEKDTIAAANTYEKNESVTDKANLPDIIFVLNETFYDLDQVLDTGTSDKKFSFIDSLDNTIVGYALSPKLGGGTNQSEYELLTSNSMYLMPTATPFVSLNLDNANTVVSYLEGLGYTTLGTHCYRPSNYSRNRAYPAIGFDYIKWDNDYQNPEEYGERAMFYTDESVYKNLNRWYEEIAKDNPVFMYCLTIQNHGQWDQNESKYDVVQTASDYGEYTDVINEYESCIYLSDKAFETLVDYYSSVERDVIIVMVGDHCPSFASDIANKFETTTTGDELERNLHSTPFVIWSNHEGILNDVIGDKNRFSLFYLAPTVLQAAGMPLSGYYDYLVNMRDAVPVIMKNGTYYDSDFVKYGVSQNSEYSDLVNRYLHYEYLNINNPGAARSFFQ